MISPLSNRDCGYRTSSTYSNFIRVSGVLYTSSVLPVGITGSLYFSSFVFKLHTDTIDRFGGAYTQPVIRTRLAAVRGEKFICKVVSDPIAAHGSFRRIMLFSLESKWPRHECSNNRSSGVFGCGGMLRIDRSSKLGITS